MVKNVLLFTGGLLLFLTGCISYGILLNLREKPLQQEMAMKGLAQVENPKIVINRSTFELALYSDTILVKKYRAVFGRNPLQKSYADDNATPVGTYKICEIFANHKYWKLFKLTYPNLQDVEAGLANGSINQNEYEKLRFDNNYGNCVNAGTKLGGNIGIHGIGELNFIFKNLPFVFNWTDGSIAVSNENIDELYNVITKGTEVVIIK
ncbi:MAG: L,D-transpeptidase [Ignavibacteriaceae bacterium]|jgi:murein L,D-transpeptidase YafK|nr:L,D-transpeptidase [Ignavibacteriaceae bacterium]